MDKWLAVSNLQKAIRRSQKEIAIDMATELWAIDNAYLRYRTAVILIEDIGAANIPLLTIALEGKLGKRWIDARGGLPWFLENVITPAVLSNKDRTACDLGIISKNNRKHFEEKHGTFEQLSIEQALDIYTDPMTSITEKGLSAWRVAGTDLFPHASLPEKVQGDWNKWLELNKQLGVSDEVINIMALAQKSQREWHAIYLGMTELASTKHTIKTDTFESPSHNGVLLAAADVHTRIGQMAIKQYLKKNTELMKVLTQYNKVLTYDEVEHAISKMIFLLEGGKINPSIVYDLSTAVDKISKQQWSAFTQLPGNTIATTVWKTLPLLQDCRISTINNIFPKLEENNAYGL